MDSQHPPGPHGSPSDEQLLTRFVKGDRNSLGELAQRYELALLGLSCGMLGGRRDLAMDVVQETWIRVIRFAHTFNNASRVKTWLYRIAINQCRDVQAKIKTNGAALSDADRSDAQSEPSFLAQEHDDRRWLHEAVQRLSPVKRSVVLLCYHADMTHEHAAEILNIPLGTLKSRLNAALTELRNALSVEELR